MLSIQPDPSMKKTFLCISIFVFLGLSEELDSKNEGIRKLANVLAIRLKSRYARNTLQRVNFRFYLEIEDTLTKPIDHNETNAQRRIKESQVFTLNRRFRDTMNQYNQEVLAHRDRCKVIILRELEMGRSS